VFLVADLQYVNIKLSGSISLYPLFEQIILLF
jgi:hypothetical protein